MSLVEEWPVTIDHLRKILGASRTRLTNLKKELWLKEGEDYVWGSKPGSPAMLLFHKEGAVKLALRLTTVEAADFLHVLGVRTKSVPRIEYACVKTISAALDSIVTCYHHRSVGPYIVDLYIPELRLAIECDELGHSCGYDKDEERSRQEMIEMVLGCDFLRFNPNDPTFNIGQLINKILIRLKDIQRIEPLKVNSEVF